VKVTNALRTIRNFTRQFNMLAAALLLGGVAIKPAQAHVIDRIEINHVGDEAEIQILFDVRIQYLREASLNNNEIHIFVKLLEADPDPRLVPEAMDSPPSDIAPHFTVSFPELDSSLVINFGEKVAYRVQTGKDGRSISIFTPVIKPKGESHAEAAVSPAAPRTPDEVERDAKQLMVSAREAIGHDQVVTAIETLNRLLNLPPNQQSQTAQELIGEAREKNGEFEKARVEYELYLKLYPDAADAAQVKARLARLPQAGAKPTFRIAQKKTVDEKMMVYGGISQNYYKGMSHTDTTTANSNGITSASLTSTDQSILISSLDMTGRKRTDTTDTRIVLRDVYNANFLRGQASDNRLDSAYVEQSGRDHSYLYRLGRQAGLAGGVPGRFDGVWLGYSPDPAWRVNGVVGTPVDFYNSAAESKTFTGVSVDLTRLPEQWSGSGYFIQQKVAGIVDRHAVGMEAHYFDTQRNYNGLLDYDTLFKAVNIATLQGNWTTGAGGNYNLLLDHRKSPPLQITNALQGQPVQTIAAALSQPGASVDTLRADAQALSATSNLFLVGMTQPYSAHWRLGGDFRIANTSGTGASGTVPAMPGTGNTYIYTMQAIANNLFLENDLNVISASYVDDHRYEGRSLAFNRVETLRKNWRLDMSLQLYTQSDILGVHQTRITPSLKLGYHLNDAVSLEGEGGIEDNHTYSATQDDKTRRRYFYVGYRWDFR
jgi:tetratricopeptide (TPR) repeat protein